MACQVEGCERPENRDSLCLPHKLRTVRLNTARLKAYREANVTSRELKKEIFEGAKATGQDIMQVRGRRAATQVYDNGAWKPA